MSFETFFLGREKIKNPFVEKMISASKKIGDKGAGSISMRYGSRIIITSKNASLSSLTENDFVEVVDYDAVRNIALVIGMSEPSSASALHWFIYRREGINAIISVFDKDISEPDFDIAMEALKLLRNSNCIKLKNYGHVSVGKNMEEALEGLKCL
ncbi:MAG: class II aldolase/adducin family protein [Thermoplasmata archaeon]|nr:class II aldolase/adducin family protein [Thermoplasmata archaeon]